MTYTAKIRHVVDTHPGLKKAARLVAHPLRKWRYEKEAKEADKWVRQHIPTSDMLQRQKTEAANFAYRPLISIVVPLYDTPKSFFAEMTQSVFAQTYDNWELVLVDDASPNPDIRDWVRSCSAENSKIVYKLLETNHRIAGATNEGIKKANGEFIALLDHDDVLFPDALYEVAKALNENMSLSLIYTDEVKLDQKGKYYHPFFKPDWNPDFLRSVNYITHFTTIRKSVLDKVGYEDSTFDGTQDWELFLRVTRNIAPKEIYHIPQIVYAWRVHENSTAKSFDAKPYLIAAQRKALEADLAARSCVNAQVEADPRFLGQWRISYAPRLPTEVAIFILDGKKTPQHKGQDDRIGIITDTIDSSIDFLQKLADTTAEYILLVSERTASIDLAGLTDMLGDAERQNIAFVLSGARSERQAIDNITDIICAEAVHLVRLMSHLSVTRHLYATTRYNIAGFDKGIAVIAAKKLRSLAQKNTLPNISSLSREATKAGYSNIYNPCVKMVK